MDSEGTICITGDRYTKLIVGAANTDLRLMKWLVENFGSTYNKTARYSKRFGDHYYYGWGMRGPKKEWFLRGIFPHVMLKKEQVKIGLEYISLNQRPEIEKRLQLKKIIQGLNESYKTFASSVKENRDAAKYAAGFIDGDGSIFISSQGLVGISLGSLSAEVIDWFVQNFGGKRYDNQTTPMKKPYFAWRIYDNSTREKFLLRVIPYLLLKRDQAKLALLAVRLGQGKSTESVRLDLAKKCMILNHGRSSVTTETREDKQFV